MATPIVERSALSQPVANGKPAPPFVGRNNPQSNYSGDQDSMESGRDVKMAPQTLSEAKNIVRRKLTGFVGFANLPNQWHRKSVRKGFNFNIMVVGKAISNYTFMKISSNMSRRIRAWEIDACQYSLQLFALSSKSSTRSKPRDHT